MFLQGPTRVVALALSLIAALSAATMAIYLAYLGSEGGHTSGALFLGALLLVPLAAFGGWLFVGEVRRAKGKE